MSAPERLESRLKERQHTPLERRQAARRRRALLLLFTFRDGRPAKRGIARDATPSQRSARSEVGTPRAVLCERFGDEGRVGRVEEGGELERDVGEEGESVEGSDVGGMVEGRRESRLVNEIGFGEVVCERRQGVSVNLSLRRNEARRG